MKIWHYMAAPADLFLKGTEWSHHWPDGNHDWVALIPAGEHPGALPKLLLKMDQDGAPLVVQMNNGDTLVFGSQP